MADVTPTSGPFPDIPGCPCYGGAEGCICPAEERYLRAVIAGQQKLSPEQREWCRKEIVAIEGHTADEADGEDSGVARNVLHAWVDFCRDKGLM